MTCGMVYVCRVQPGACHAALPGQEEREVMAGPEARYETLGVVQNQ